MEEFAVAPDGSSVLCTACTLRALFLLGEEFLDPLTHDLLALGFLPIQFAVPAIAHVALLVDQVDGRPVLILSRLPGQAPTVHGDRVLHPVVFDLFADLLDLLLLVGLGRVDADNDQPFFVEILVPARVPRVITDAIDSAEGPEMENNHLPPQV
jgi:hypothetical protein